MQQWTFLTSVLVLVAVLIGSPQRLIAQSNDSREEFAKAHYLYTNGKTAQAKELFQSSIESGYRLADYSLYYLARLAHDETNWDQSRKYLTQLRQGFPHSVWYRAAALLLAKADIAEKKFGQAANALRELRNDKSAPREIADEAHFLHAQLHEAQGDVGRAYSVYRELRNGSPGSRWAAAARNEQARLRSKFPDRFTLTTIESLAEEAERLARERQSKDAEELYKKILDRISEPAPRLRYLAKLAELHLSTGSRNEAIPILERIARDYPFSAEAPKRCTRSDRFTGTAMKMPAPSTISNPFWRSTRRAVLATGRCMPAPISMSISAAKMKPLVFTKRYRSNFPKALCVMTPLGDSLGFTTEAVNCRWLNWRSAHCSRSPETARLQPRHFTGKRVSPNV
jgi:tetratricopeptide (TPR) repeat protein